MKTQTQVAESTVTKVVLPDFQNTEAVKAFVASLNRAKIDKNRNYILDLELGTGFTLHAIHVKPATSRNPKEGAKAALVAVVGFKFGTKGELSMNSWRLLLRTAGEKAGSFSLVPPAYRPQRGGDDRPYSIFAVPGLHTFMTELVTKIYQKEKVEVAVEPELEDTNI